MSGDKGYIDHGSFAEFPPPANGLVKPKGTPAPSYARDAVITRLRDELANANGAVNVLKADAARLTRELAEAKAIIRGKTFGCPLCEGMAKERDEARAKLRALTDQLWTIVNRRGRFDCPDFPDWCRQALGALLEAIEAKEAR